MISVLPVNNTEELQQLYVDCNLIFENNSKAVTAVCSGEILGYCLFDLTEKGILIRALTPENDTLLADGILRSALHIAAERSAMDARYSATAPEDLLRKIGFVLPGDERRLNIDLLFSGCNCKK